MVRLLLILPIMNLSQINDEQGIALIGAYLRKNGYSVELQVVKSIEDIDKINLKKYAIVGITLYHENIPYVYKMCEFIKKKEKNILVCLGGYSATYYYEEILNDCSYIDFIIKGEGEETFLEVCNKLSQNQNIFDIQGLAYAKDGEIISNPDRLCINNLEDIPFAAKDIFEKQKLNLVQISTSRGCLNNCSFCYSHTYFDPTGKIKWRGRTVESVIDEIKSIKKKYEIDKIYFNNASFEDSLPARKFVKEFAKEIIKQEIDISYCANFRANFYKFCNDELKNLLIKSGLTGVFLGIEAFNNEDLKIYNKHTTLKDNLNSIDLFRNINVGLDIGFINFNPYSSIDSLKQNAMNLYKTGFLCSLNFMNRLRAYKGTPLYAQIEKDNLLKHDGYLDYYNYAYVNKDIEKFSSYINQIFIDEYSSIINNMYYFTMYHNQLISHLKRVYRKDMRAYSIVEQYEYIRDTILNEANEYCYFWYSRVLQILEKGWDSNQANRFLENESVHKKMQRIEQKLKKEYYMLGKRLLQIDKKAIVHLK